MSVRSLRSAVLSLIVVMAAVAPVTAQKNKATSKPATVDFRCDEDQPVPCGVVDRVLGVEGDVYGGTGTPEGGQGAHLRSNGEMWIGLRNGLEAVLDFAQLDVDGACVAAGNCRFASAGLTSKIRIPIGGSGPAGIYSEIQGDVVSMTNPADTTPSLLSLPVNDPGWKLRLFLGFTDAVMGLGWGFNFAANRYPGATDANVIRTDACTWKIWADGDARAGLSAYGSDYGKGKSYRTNEGLYIAPFEITFHVPSLCGS